MGFIRDDFGRVSVESRRESFCIHWGVDEEDPAYDEHEALQKFWREVPHPEFGYGDLDDLIAALIDLRDNDKNLAGWKSSQTP